MVHGRIKEGTVVSLQGQSNTQNRRQAPKQRISDAVQKWPQNHQDYLTPFGGMWTEKKMHRCHWWCSAPWLSLAPDPDKRKRGYSYSF